jgi:hypothetical protein
MRASALWLKLNLAAGGGVVYIGHVFGEKGIRILPLKRYNHCFVSFFFLHFFMPFFHA